MKLLASYPNGLEIADQLKIKEMFYDKRCLYNNVYLVVSLRG